MRTSMDMLNGSLWDKILKFSMPVAATAILEQFFTATDVVIAGNFANSDRTAAMAAVGTDLPIIGMIIFLFLGLALGSNVVIAQSIGRRDTEGVKKAVHTAVLLSLIIRYCGSCFCTVCCCADFRFAGNSGRSFTFSCDVPQNIFFRYADYFAVQF